MSEEPFESLEGAMTATDELRRMLDERGVEWEESNEWSHRTFLKNPPAGRWCMLDSIVDDDVELTIGGLTKEQAIDAALRSGTCKRVLYKPTGVYVCSECGFGLSKKLDKYCYLRYCPNCGRKIEVEE